MNITWMDKMTNEDLYGNLPRISNKIRERRLRLAEHCVRHSELELNNLVLWEPTQGKFNRGSQRLTYVDRLRKDTGVQTTAKLKTLMKDSSACGVPLPEETRPDDDDVCFSQVVQKQMLGEVKTKALFNSQLCRKYSC